MTSLNKLLMASVAACAIALPGAASAAISVGGAGNVTYISSTSQPPVGTAFGSAGNIVTLDQTGAAAFGSGQLFTIGNIVTFSLSQGNFSVLPTVSVTNCATPGSMTAVYNSGGAGQSFVRYQLTGTDVTDCEITLTGVRANTVGSAAPAATVNVVVSDSTGAGALNSTAASARTVTIATFAAPYSFSFTSAGSANTTVSLSAANPGAVYTGIPTLGSVTVTPAGASLTPWGTTALSVGAGTPTLTLSIPTGGFVSASLTGCTATPASVTTQSSPGTVVFPNVSLPAPNAVGAVTCGVDLGNPSTSATAALGVGATSAAISIPVLGAPQATYTAQGNLATITYAAGAGNHFAGYITGDSANYDSFISVSTGATGGAIVITGRTAGSSYSAVMTLSLAANTNRLYTFAEIKAALEAAGMPTANWATDGDRGALDIVAPAGARVVPLLRNKQNGQVVEMGYRQ